MNRSLETAALFCITCFFHTKFQTIGKKTKGIKKNSDGSYDIYFGPKPPKGFENNWLETIPGKSWFTVIRMYGPLEPWIEKVWRPSEVELVK